ncbi:hypothetical protein G6O69_12555 [Pseudenhygromyxa sp. WMMC2535]|uniref:hypothetical protein n=1 Tax=Pseudenhygromyxa sp. WMMC2535 TaxID=2712867 RepID=UPI00155644C9|nr:hypothetical protein [Pseudenhygromyxa sp. WMMC2535]NVB38664.1 hypothetical protein [Pseudenhygromyxa sp. WMMC2535]
MSMASCARRSSSVSALVSTLGSTLLWVVVASSACAPGGGGDGEGIDEGGGNDGGGVEALALVEVGDLEAWAVLDAEADPLADHRPETIECPLGAWREEYGELEVQTGVCNYLALGQGSLVDLEVGDQVVVDLWHDALDAAEPAVAHVALLVDGEIIGEQEVDIPSAAQVLRFEWEASAAISAGAPVVFHLHNHGYNAWTLVEVRALVH